MSQPKPTEIILEVWKGPAGHCIIATELGSQSGKRIAGAKLWGGEGSLVASFTVDRQRLMDDLKEI